MVRCANRDRQCHHGLAAPLLTAQLREIGPTLTVLEATGGVVATLVATLAAALAAALAQADLALAVVNPRQVRDLAKASGTLAKTDAIDAQ